MAERTTLTNIAAIGTEANPVNKIHVRYIIGCKNLTYDSPVYSEGPEAETLTGIEVNSTTNAVTNVSNTTMTGTVQINNTLGVTGTATMVAITASGLITANGGVTAGGHFKMGTWNLSGAGGNVGLGFSAAAATFSSTVTVTGEAIFNGVVDVNAVMKLGTNYIGYGGTPAKGLGFNASDAATFTESLSVNDSIACTDGPIEAKTKFAVNGTDGWTGTFDKAVDNTIAFIGGIATGKT